MIPPVPPRGDSIRADMDDAVRLEVNDRLTMPAEHAGGAGGVDAWRDPLAVGAVSPIGAGLKTTDVSAHTRDCSTVSAPLPFRKLSASRRFGDRGVRRESSATARRGCDA
ncbi:hypothetical protein SBD_1635 [Streptomyces bottropensis ATCC 25435]|uniref:Uncharacterized protein n=1 Tax=Streptomyces bottropensis ATCC 25435 TaxID=1054862 RepID=M3FXX4_9ACTN|nr:hypothetical protein SBD_1635 [Streptomyces bottropensis ATCC 25435]